MYDGAEPATAAETGGAITEDLMRVGRRWRARLNERLKVVDQTDARLACLAEITGASEGLVQRELSRRLGVEEPTIVRLVDALEARDCVERRVSGVDRRAKIVQSRPAAVPVLHCGSLIVSGLQEELFSGMDPLDLAACARVLNELSCRLARPQQQS